MSEEPENLVLRYLRRIDERLDTIERKLDEVIVRVGKLERRSPNFTSTTRSFISGWTISIAVSHASSAASIWSKCRRREGLANCRERDDRWCGAVRGRRGIHQAAS